MYRAMGIDPGTVSFDICGLEGDRVFLERSIPTAEVTANPQILLDVLLSTAPVDMIVGPSGYGLPWVKAQNLTPQDIDLLLLSDERDRGREAVIGGMVKMMQFLKESELPIYFAPGVIHLASVPAHRKVNRIDMGTADKLCAVALGVWEQSRRLEIGYDATSFIYVELGGAFSSVITVEKGKIVDGFGGASGCLGYLSLGAMDGELAYLLGGFHKELLCSGGMAYISGRPQASPEEIAALAQTDNKCRLAWKAFMESIVKCVAAEMSIFPSTREILISGRLCRIEAIRNEVVRLLRSFAPVRKIEGFARVKEAAQGAALIAKGLAGGANEGLVAAMGIKEVSGASLDHLYVKGADVLRKKHLG